MKQKLSKRNLMFVGIMLFGMFFGAGNLIFPVNMGQEAGNHLLSAVIGFLITGVGIPILGVAAIGITDSDGVFDLASNVSHSFAYVFTIILVLIIGPLYAIPRLAATSFQIGIDPFLGGHNSKIGLLVFAAIFFVIVWILAAKPGKILEYIGKVLTPLFLVLLAIILIMTLIKPMGSVSIPKAVGQYVSSPFSTGFIDGYNTLDGIVSLVFGIVIVNVLRELGVKEPKAIAKSTIKAGLIAGAIMAVIYALLAYAGTTSLGHFKISANGGIALVQIATYYFGSFGNVLLAAIIIVACLKTAVGLASSFGDTMTVMFPKINYQIFMAASILVAFLLSNVGLDAIIAFAVPVLMFIYPFAIALIVVALLTPLTGKSRSMYVSVTIFTIIPAALGGLASVTSIANVSWVKDVLAINKYLPFGSIGMGWVVPVVVGLIVGYLFQLYFNSKKK